MHTARNIILALAAVFLATAHAGCAGARVELVEHDAADYQELSPGMYSVKQSRGFEDALPYEPWEQITHIPLGNNTREDAASGRRGATPLAAHSPHLRAHEFALVALFKTFQLVISKYDMSRCELSPTCSRFGLQATSMYGFRGVILTFARLMHDHNAEHYRRDPDNEDDKLDPVENYIFFWRPARLDNHDAHEDPANAWDEHVRATE